MSGSSRQVLPTVSGSSRQVLPGRWGEAPGGRRVPVTPAFSRCLLDLDPDLADTLDSESRRLARAAATAVVLEAEPGPVAMADWLSVIGTGPGVLTLSGVMALSVRVGDRVSAELNGAGDLIQPLWSDGDQLLSWEVAWRALTPMRFALLDEAFAKRVRFWPQIGHALLRRAGRRTVNLDIQRAIAAQPRLEIRLALLLWHLGSRWGKVSRDGVRLPVPLTHHLLGQLVGAERPSVTHALARLAHSGLITGHGDEWHLHDTLQELLPAMVQDETGRAEQIVAAVSAGRGAARRP